MEEGDDRTRKLWEVEHWKRPEKSAREKMYGGMEKREKEGWRMGVEWKCGIKDRGRRERMVE